MVVRLLGGWRIPGYRPQAQHGIQDVRQSARLHLVLPDATTEGAPEASTPPFIFICDSILSYGIVGYISIISYMSNGSFSLEPKHAGGGDIFWLEDSLHRRHHKGQALSHPYQLC